MEIYRHGENLIIEVNKFPKGKIKKSKSLIVGHSETGHHHVLEGTDIESIQLEELFFRIANPTPLVHKKTHDKHNTITIQPGIYKVIPKTEYNPFTKVIEIVWD